MDKKTFINELLVRGININDQQYEQLIRLMKDTLQTNEKFNLTAIKEEDAFLEKMIFDSAIALQELDLTDKKVIDVGTGAGFPGLVLYILNPKTNLTLLDSTSKKIEYLSNYAKENNYKINFLTARAEETGIKEEFDYAFARAVASLNILVELIIPMLKVGGYFIAMKGPGYEKEIMDSLSAFKKLGCSLYKIVEDDLPESNEKRVMIYIRKDKKTNNKYPRIYKDIKNMPL